MSHLKRYLDDLSVWGLWPMRLPSRNAEGKNRGPCTATMAIFPRMTRKTWPVPICLPRIVLVVDSPPSRRCRIPN